MSKKSKKRIVESIDQPTLFADIEKKQYTDEQEKFITFKGRESVLLIATAGSGKTYCSVERLKFLIKQGVPPEKIIFFSFTKAATDELVERIGNDAVKITTIHAFSFHILSKIGKFKKVATFYDFVNWFKKNYKPKGIVTEEEKHDFNEKIHKLYDESDYISSSISAYKLQMADGIKVPVPEFFHTYQEFLRKERSRDFSDMLIEVRSAFEEDKWLNMFKNRYDYIFIDEYQDTSTIQLQVLLALNAKYYYLIGDRNQAIYSYSGTNCDKVEEMLKNRRSTTEMSLTMNFRSDKSIITNSNKFSSLKAIANSKEEGFVNKDVILDNHELGKILGSSRNQVVALVRTNTVIRNLELYFLKRKLPMRYFNYLTPAELNAIPKGIDFINDSTKNKLKVLLGADDGKGNPIYDSYMDIYSFIKTYENSNNFITSIHKSKGREFDVCIVINSLPPDLIHELGYDKLLSKKQLKRITFSDKEEDQEQKNIHYVAVSRSKHGLYFMVAN